MKRLLIGLALLIGASLPAYSQGSPLCYTTNGSNCVKVGVAGSSAFGPLPVTGSFSATTTGFTPATTGTPISVTTGGVTGTLPVGAVVVVSNAGSTNNAYCKLGASATTGDQLIAPSSWFAYTVGAATQLTCITSTSTTTVNMSGGSGLPTGAGGGGSTSTNYSLETGGNLAAILSAVSAAVPGQAPTVSIGGVGIVDSAGTNVATVKAASTLPGATDKTLVVGINPGTSVPGTPTGAIVTVQPPSGDPCQAQTPTIKPFTVATGTTQNIVTGTLAKKIYVCYLYMQTGLANNVAVISGTTGASCGANTAALVGGTTAASGLINAANSGQAFGNGGYAVMQVLTNNDDICIITSASGPLAGLIKYVVQ